MAVGYIKKQLLSKPFGLHFETDYLSPINIKYDILPVVSTVIICRDIGVIVAVIMTVPVPLTVTVTVTVIRKHFCNKPLIINKTFNLHQINI